MLTAILKALHVMHGRQRPSGAVSLQMADSQRFPLDAIQLANGRPTEAQEERGASVHVLGRKLNLDTRRVSRTALLCFPSVFFPKLILLKRKFKESVRKTSRCFMWNSNINIIRALAMARDRNPKGVGATVIN